MFLVKANTYIQVQAPKSETHYDWANWRPYCTKEDKLYDKHEVWDMIAVYNRPADVPAWAQRNIMEFNKVVLCRDNKYALVNRKDIEFVD